MKIDQYLIDTADDEELKYYLKKSELENDIIRELCKKLWILILNCRDDYYYAEHIKEFSDLEKQLKENKII